MTFKDVILKNFFGSISKYISYFLSGAFCSAIFFIYTTMLLLDDVASSVSEYPMQALFVVTCLLIMVFSVFFISYSHRAFVRNKKKELGVYMIVGMDERDMRKMLGSETLIVAAAATLTGMLVGSLFARLFQLAAINLVEIEDMGYRLSVWNYVVTAAVFAVLYTVCFYKTNKEMKKEDISSMMRDARKKEGRDFRRSDIVLTLTGLICMIFSTIFILNIAVDKHLNSKLWVLLVFLVTGYGGLFMLINFGGKTIVWLLHKRKKYYHSMLAVSEMEHKYSQNIKVMLILAMMASVIVLLVGSPIALVSISRDIAEDGNRDLEFMPLSEYDEQAVQNIVNKMEIEAWDKTQVTYAFDVNGVLKPVLAASAYNQKMGTSLAVKDGTIYHMITTWMPGTLGVDIGTQYTVYAGQGTSANPAVGKELGTYTVCESVKGNWMCANMFKSMSILVLSDNDYAAISGQLTHAEVSEITYREDWMEIREIIDELHKELGDNVLISSRLDVYTELKHGYSVFLFLTCTMCMMFFISTGCVLYFKQYNEIDDERAQYKKLYRLGIGDKTVRRTISIKMAVVYFVPLIGSVMGILIMYYMANLFGGGNVSEIFMSKGLIGFVGYSISQLLFYLLLRARYVRDVVRG